MHLRKFTNSDFPIMSSWLCKEHVKEFFGDSNEWLDEIKTNFKNSNWVVYYIAYEGDTPVGFVQYYETHKAPPGIWSNEQVGTVSIDFLIGDENYLHKGYGPKLIKSLINIIQRTNKYRFIVADPESNNSTSISLLLKNGFIKQNNAYINYS